MIGAGTLSAILGVAGIFLPLLPATPFFLLAAFFYSKSSEKFHSGLLNNRYIGNYIKNYQSGKGIPLKVKTFSVLLLWISILYSAIFIVENIYIKIFLVLTAIIVTAHIFSIKTFKQ